MGSGNANRITAAVLILLLAGSGIGQATDRGTSLPSQAPVSAAPAIDVPMPLRSLMPPGSEFVPVIELAVADDGTPAEKTDPALSERGVGPVNSAPAAAPVGLGVTGTSKDNVLGSDEDRQESEIKKTLPVDQRLSNAEPGVPVGLRLSGAATAGYYQAATTNGYAVNEASPIGSLRLDGSGYVHSPGFLNFTVKPEGSLGRQSSEGVFPDGDGVSANTTFLGGGVAPLTVSYQRFNRKIMTFGPLDRLAGLEANTFQDSLGADWRLHLKHFPEIGLNISRYSDSYEPLSDLAPKAANAGRMLSGDISEKVLGWNLQSSYRVERSSQDLINIFDPTQAPYLYRRDGRETRASADREFGKWISTSFVGGVTKSQNEVQGRPFDQSFRFLTGNAFLHPGKKLMVSLRAGVTDNIIGASLERALGGSSVPDQPVVLLPTEAKLRMISYSGAADYALTDDLRVHTDFVREGTRAPQTSDISTANSWLTSVQAGASYLHHFRWWQVQASYAANSGRFSYTTAGKSYGHRANLGVMVGAWQSMELSAEVHGSLQNVTGGAFMYDRSAGASLTVSRSIFEHWKLRASYDREGDRYKFAGTDYSSVGNGAMFALVHPRAELSASYNLRDGLTFQADPSLQFLPPNQGGPLAGAFPGTLIVPTGATWSNAALVIHPIPKLTGRASWMRSQQRLQGLINNQYTEWEASAGYQFRSISIDAGYILHNQNFLIDRFNRNRFFFRIVREFTIF